MPIYEYECSACGTHHEILQKMSEEPLQECPACHALALKKLLSAAGFRLSGSGWYETDFKKDNRRNLHEPSASNQAKDSAASAATSSSDKSSTASKPDSATSTKSATQPAKKKTTTS